MNLLSTVFELAIRRVSPKAGKASGAFLCRHRQSKLQKAFLLCYATRRENLLLNSGVTMARVHEKWCQEPLPIVLEDRCRVQLHQIPSDQCSWPLYGQPSPNQPVSSLGNDAIRAVLQQTVEQFQRVGFAISFLAYGSPNPYRQKPRKDCISYSAYRQALKYITMIGGGSYPFGI